MGTRETFPVQHGAKGRRWIFVLLSVLGVLAIVVVSFLPNAEKRSLHTRGQLHSPGHLIAFGVVAFLAVRSAWSARVRVLLVVFLAVLGFWVELGEHLMFRGGFEWKDLVVDVIGIVGGTLLALGMEPNKT